MNQPQPIETRVLACDAGNSRVKAGLFAVSERAELPRCLHEAVLSVRGQGAGGRDHESGVSGRGSEEVTDNGSRTTDQSAIRNPQSAIETFPWDEVRRWLEDSPQAPLCCLTGSNPRLGDWIEAGWAVRFPQSRLLRLSDVTTVLPVNVDEPRKVGVDRLLNAIAANVVRDPGRPAIIIDSGTATTVDCVDGEGAFCGGAILPGFELAARSLHEYTALLPLVTVEELAEAPAGAIGKNTAAAIRSGLYRGQVGAVRELVTRFAASLAGTPLQLLTGGGAGLLAPEFPAARWEPHLSLQGLTLAALRRSA